jgi:hypothetical protein
MNLYGFAVLGIHNPGSWILALALWRWIADYDCEIAVHGGVFLSF